VDVIKVQMQMAGVGVTGQRPTIMQTAARLLREDGVSGFCRGLSPSLLREMSYSGIRMGLYEPTKQALGATDPKHTGLHLKVLSGAITGTIGSVLANPLDLIKVRMQSGVGQNGRAPYASVASALMEISKESGGVRNLWRGCGPTMQRAALVTASQVPSYDHVKHHMINAGYLQEGYKCHFFCCMVAGVVAAAVTSPVDLAKSRVMAQPVDPHTGKGLLYQGTFDCLRRVAITEGPVALFKGFNGQWLRLGPHTTISLMIFEHLRHIAGMNYL